jgi:hypothetical protein
MFSCRISGPIVSKDDSSTIRTLIVCRNATEFCTRTALIAVMSLAAAQPTWAQTTNPNPPPIPSPSVPFKQTSTLGAAQSAQQHTAAINNNTAGLAANATGALTAMSEGLGVMVAYGVAVTGIPGSAVATAAVGVFAASSTSLRCFQSCPRTNPHIER